MMNKGEKMMNKGEKNACILAGFRNIKGFVLKLSNYLIDWDTDDFYLNRKDLIDQRIRQLEG